MDQPAGHVKGGRRYDSSGRRERAARTRDLVVAVAEERFTEDGYAGATVSSIAAVAEVSVDTIYKTFGGKPGLVRAIYERALQGTGPVPAEQRSDRLQAEETDPRRIISGWGRFVTELAPRAARIHRIIRDAAAADPELTALLRQIDDDRLVRMTANARRMSRAGHLKPGLSVRAAADVLWTYSSPELYDLLVVRRGMPLAEYGRFVAAAMSAALLP